MILAWASPFKITVDRYYAGHQVRKKQRVIAQYMRGRIRSPRRADASDHTFRDEMPCNSVKATHNITLT